MDDEEVAAGSTGRMTSEEGFGDAGAGEPTGGASGEAVGMGRTPEEDRAGGRCSPEVRFGVGIAVDDPCGARLISVEEPVARWAAVEAA